MVLPYEATFETAGAAFKSSVRVRHAADLGDAVAVLQPRSDLHDVDGLADGA